MIMNVSGVCMSGNNKLVLALRPAHSQLVADTVGFFRCDLPGKEGLADLITQHILVYRLFPACGCLVLTFP